VRELMNKKMLVIFLILVIVPIAADDTPVIVCTTTALESLAREVGGEKVDVVSLVQPGVCPSHFDVRPSHVAEVGKASLILYHGMEPWLDGLITASGNQDVVRAQLEGPWNAPELAIKKIEQVSDALIQADPQNASYYEENAAAAVAEIQRVADTIKRETETLEVETTPVLCMEWQQYLVEWLGFTIVGMYGPPETLSVKDVHTLIAQGSNANVMLVIDNLQSGTELGSEIAAEVGAYHVTLTNFPNAVPETDTIAKMIEYNARQLFDAVKQYQEEEGKIAELESQLREEQSKSRVFAVIAGILVVLCIVEAIVFHVRRK
jgi:ABC-type Zn uptake system ZnuABC Zn-binding protein ZnuA